ncbi:hypothetical protein AVEN_265747-1 [Araneus ventricosus]|uniref:Uncharacterized protein n=1 Tax=Araneus ventricosus TaxID=182803 RepID=A0A4Y2VJW3_ARAVE|nr:hypothetical protein AVEN_265747-1 [Araneus ventricosus]
MTRTIPRRPVTSLHLSKASLPCSEKKDTSQELDVTCQHPSVERRQTLLTPNRAEARGWWNITRKTSLEEWYNSLEERTNKKRAFSPPLSRYSKEGVTWTEKNSAYGTK